MKRQSGVAMIVVLVMVLIFLSLIMAVVLTSTVASRRANYYRDRLIALQIAESGVQDCLYWMNYRGYWTQSYPSYYVNPATVAYFQGSDWPGTDTWIATEPAGYNPTGVIGGKCVLSFEDNVDTDMDRIISTGYYRGRTVQVAVRLRGQNGLGNTQHVNGWRALANWYWDGSSWIPYDATWGIPEAFNKHVIYGRDVTGTSGRVKGNIFCNTCNLSSSTSPESTITKTTETAAYFDYSTKPETEKYQFPAVPTNYKIKFESGWIWYDHNDDGTYDESILLPTSSPPGTVGVYYNGSAYVFEDTQIDVTFTVEGTAWFNHPNNAVSNYAKITGNLTISDSITTETGLKRAVFDVDGSVIPITAIDIRGDFIVKNGAASMSLTDVSVYGCLGSNKTISLSGGLVDASTSSYKAGIILYCTVNQGVTCTVGSSTSVGIGVNQDVGIFAFSAVNTVGVNINRSLAVPFGKASVVAYAPGSGGAATVTLGSGVNIDGLVFCVGGVSSGAVSISTSGAIKGAVVTNGRVQFNNPANVEYDGIPYKTTSSVYKDFKGGRRVYVPVPGSWQIE